MAEAFEWYEDRKAGLGHEFLAEVRQALRAVAEQPLRHPILYRNARRVLTRRFPYKVYYLVEDERVEVLGVAHVRRDPQTWRGRV